MFIKNTRKVFFLAILFAVLPAGIAFALKCGEGEVNPAFSAICDIIIFLQGRVGRSMIVFTMSIAGWKIMKGGIEWRDFLSLIIGIGFFFFPKTFALFLLPSYVEGLTGYGYDPNMRYSPDEILTCICPDLR